VAYTTKFMVKKRAAAALDYVVMPLEGLWWSDDMATFTTGDKSAWQWTLMILQPPFVEEATLRAAIDDVARRKNLPALERLRYEHWTEGLCAQVLHVGPFSDEGPTIQRLHAHIAAQRGALTGRHHEIYLSDIRRARPERWRTIIRQPMMPAT